ncbi:MAG: MmgE/PrpD family protein, partial [Pseudomonadota bacterium]|nr:MmgE/PrpD family protein [Pseudomonadota bacterium]
MTDYLMPLSRFLAETEFADLPAAAVDRARRVLADSLAAIAAGSAEPEVRALTEKMTPSAPGAASLIGQEG